MRKRRISLWLDEETIRMLDELSKEFGSRSKAMRRLVRQILKESIKFKVY